MSQPNHIVQQVQTLPRIEPQVHRIISSQGGLIQNSTGGQAKPMILIAKKPAVIGEQQIFIPFPANGIANAPIQNLQKIQMQPVHTIQEHLPIHELALQQPKNFHPIKNPTLLVNST